MLAEPIHIALPRYDRAERLLFESMAALFAQARDRDNDAGTITDSRELEDIRRSQDGDSHAYRRLVEQHQPTVGKLLWRFTRDRNEHEELTQQVFVEAYMSLASYRAKAPFEHWLARIATRVGYRFWTANRRKEQSLPDEVWNRIAKPAADAPDSETASELVHHLLAQLPPRDRLVLTLRYIQQCDIEQTAYRTGWTKTLVRVQTHRAINKLKKLAAKAQIELEL